MQKLFYLLLVVVLSFFLMSCISIQDRQMSQQERSTANIAGFVSTEFSMFQALHIPNNKHLRDRAYVELMKAAAKQFESNFEVRNITIVGTAVSSRLGPIGSWQGFHSHIVFWVNSFVTVPLAFFGNIQRVTAIGEVILLD